MVTNTQGELFAAIMAACLVAFVAQIMAENSTTGYQSPSNTTQTTGHSAPNAYIISSVQFDIGVMENETGTSGESGTTPAQVETDELTDTKVEFLVPPASLFNQPNTTAAT